MKKDVNGTPMKNDLKVARELVDIVRYQNEKENFLNVLMTLI